MLGRGVGQVSRRSPLGNGGAALVLAGYLACISRNTPDATFTSGRGKHAVIGWRATRVVGLLFAHFFDGVAIAAVFCRAGARRDVFHLTMHRGTEA